jgi:hypothetical protein
LLCMHPQSDAEIEKCLSFASAVRPTQHIYHPTPREHINRIFTRMEA